MKRSVMVAAAAAAAAVGVGAASSRRRSQGTGAGSQPTSVRFTEEMAGHVRLDATDPTAVGQSADGAVACMFHLTIDTGDLDTFIAEPTHSATAVGWIECAAFGGRRPVERGEFNLFVDQADPTDKRMLYLLWFFDDQGRALSLTGHKVITNHRGFDLWPDTTTLYTTIVEGHVERSELDGASRVAAGILRIQPKMFARQLTTFRSSGGSVTSRAAAMSRFGLLFTGALWDVYLTKPDAKS
jgi:cholesterol oxidase